MKIASEKSFKNICRYCLKIFKDKYKLKNHMGIHENLFVCDKCDKQFYSKQAIRKHKEEVHVLKPNTVFKCDICNLVLSNGRNLAQHKSIHETKEPLKCRLCSEEFNHSRNLRRHYLCVHKIVPHYYLKIGLNQFKEFKCDICGEQFGRKDNLVKHQALRICLKFTCSLCKFSSKDKEEWLEHAKAQHFICEYCDFQSIYKQNLVRHLKKHK